MTDTEFLEQEPEGYTFTPPEQRYSEPHYRHKAWLAEIRYQQYLIQDRINKPAFLTFRAKEAYKTCINGLYDPANVLSNLSDIELAIIDAELALDKLRVSCRKSDVRNPQLLVINHMILDVYKLVLTRAKGGIELKYQHTDEQHQNVNQKITHEMPKQQRGFLGIGGK